MTVQSITGAVTINGVQPTFTGVDGAYDLLSTGYVQLYGVVLAQDGTASGVLKGVHTEATTGQPALLIGHGGSLTANAQGGGEDAYGFYAGANTVASGVQNDGTLSVSATGNATGVGLFTGGLFVNNGGVTVTTSGLFTNASAVVSGGGATTIINHGTITATYIVNDALQSGAVFIGNSGTMTGNITLSTGAGNEVDNIGAINGSIVFKGLSGQQLYDGRGGTLSGGVTFSSSATGGASFAYLGNDGETVHGGAANLSALGGTGNDTIIGGAGNDLIDGGAGGNDTLDGGAGNNSVLYYSATSGVTVSLALLGQAQDTGGGGIDTLSNFENLGGSKYNDHLTGDGNDNLIDTGGGGNDVIDGGGGFNSVGFGTATTGVTVSLALQGQAQNTGVGTDVLSNFQGLIGSTFNDTLEGGGPSSTFLTGGAGADTFVFKSGDGAVTVLDFSHAQGDRIDFSSFAAARGLSDVVSGAVQNGSDVIIATSATDGVKLVGVTLANLAATDFIFNTDPTVGPGVGGAPTAGSGTLTGGNGDDWLQGGTANDTLHGGTGSDYLDGGAGLNTAAYDGAFRQYKVTAAGGPVKVFGGPEGGTDFLANIQRIQFVDGYLATGTTDTAGQVYRVYEATLGRAPDQQGLANWAHALNAGTNLQTVVNGFVGSTEFQTLYGNLDNPAFVTLLYNNVLHRAPDQAGLDNWLAYIAAGHSRAEVVTGFSESPEDIAALAAPVQQGLWIEDTAAGQAARLYDTVLGRLPDASGLASWTHLLQTGTSLQTAATGFVGSAEFQSVYGNLDATNFVTLLYQNVLHRAPDTSGLNGWLSYLTQGHSRAEVVLGFSESGEHIANTAAHVDYGVWIAG